MTGFFIRKNEVSRAGQTQSNSFPLGLVSIHMFPIDTLQYPRIVKGRRMVEQTSVPVTGSA